MRFVVGLLLASTCWAVNIPLTVETTSTQAILRYKSTVASACTLTGSFDFGGTTHNLHDLNATLFTNANLDTGRADTITKGLYRQVTVGHRTAETASDGKLYSRALPAAAGLWPLLSQITLNVSCNGGADTGSILFSTKNLPMGATNPEPPPFNSDGFGNHGWPTIDWADRDAIYVDPMTGIVMKLFTGPGDMNGTRQTNQGFARAFDPNSSWTDDQNALNGSGGPYASCAGAGCQDPMLVAFPSLGTVIGGWGIGTKSVDDVQITTAGSCTDATAANRRFNACLVYHGGTICDSGTITFDLPQSDGAGDTVPSTYPAPMFSGWTTPPPGDWAPSSGTLNSSGTSITALGTAAYQRFSLSWRAGAKIRITGTDPTCPGDYCEIASVQTATTATLVENIGTLSGVAWTEAAAALKVTKTNSTGNCNFSARFNYASSGHGHSDDNGGEQRCSGVEVTVNVDKDGNSAGPWQGYLCTPRNTPSSGTVTSNLMLIIPETMEVRYLDDFHKDGGAQPVGAPAEDQLTGAGILQVQKGGWSPSDGRDKFYARVSPTMDNGEIAVLRLRYQRASGSDYQEHARYPTSNTQDFVMFNQTPSSGIGSVTDQIKAAGVSDTWWGDATMTQFSNPGMSSTHALFAVRPLGTGQDDMGYFGIFNLSTGVLGTFFPTWAGSNQKWAGIHTAGTGPSGPNSHWFINATTWALRRDTNRYFGGPFLMDIDEILISSVWETTNTALSATYAEACESEITSGPHWAKLDPNVQGAPGTTRCVSVRVKEPCSRWPRAAANEQIDFPCPYNSSWSHIQTMEEGDFISDPCANNTLPISDACDGGFGSGTNEKFLIGKKTLVSGDTYELRLVRWATCDKHVTQATSANHTDNWQVMMWPSQHCGGNATWMNGDIQAQSAIPDYWELSAGHSTQGQSPLTTGGSETVQISANGNIRIATMPDEIGALTDYAVTVNPGWQGATTGMDGIPPLQTYPSKTQDLAPLHEQRWYTDMRHFNVDEGSGAEIIKQSYTITCSLEGGTTQTYKCNNPQGVFGKNRPYFGRAGRFLLQDISAPSSVRNWVSSPFGDADNFQMCIPFVNGECRSGSIAGTDAYISVPKLSTDVGQCAVNTLAINYPCFDTGASVGGWVIQRDITQPDPLGTRYRRLTMGLSGPGRQYEFGATKTTPDGKFVYFPGVWLDGVRYDLLIAALPPWSGVRSVSNDRFRKVPVTVVARSGADGVQVRFGYDPTNFDCTARRDACIAGDGSTVFWYDSETATPQTCTSGECVVDIPALPDRVVYYRVERTNSGTVVATGPTQILGGY